MFCVHNVPSYYILFTEHNGLRNWVKNTKMNWCNGSQAKPWKKHTGYSPASLPLLWRAVLKATLQQKSCVKKTPELRCENLNMDDGQCRIPRTKLIWHRFELLKNPSEANQITEYSIVADYRKCLELASQITPIDQSELKRQRFNALVHSIDELKRIVEELKGSQQPETLYFLWSQTGDTQARRQFFTNGRHTPVKYCRNAVCLSHFLYQ